MVSIIIPVYNVEKYLAMCLNSVINQTYSDFEVILVDDGSTDNSYDICENYTAQDNRFRVIHQENAGLASARNTGIKEAKGDYLYFIDSDDCINSNLLEVLVDIAEWKSANLVQINLQSVPEDYDGNQSAIMDSYTKECLINRTWRNECREYDVIDSLYNVDRDDQSRAKDIRLTTTVVWTKLYRRECFKNFLFPEGMRMHEDQMVTHRNIVTAGGMCFLNIPLYYYRQSNASLIRTGWTPRRLAILDCYDDRLKCVSEYKEKLFERKQDLQDTEYIRATKLVDYIYLRYLVCLFRNYDVANKKMSGNEKKEVLRNIRKKVKLLLRGKPGTLKIKDSLVFHLFVVAPTVSVWMFKVRNKFVK